jgi:hypothetical protein
MEEEMKKGLTEQIEGLRAKIDRLIDDGKEVPEAKRRALVKLLLARQKWRRRKQVIATLSAD